MSPLLLILILFSTGCVGAGTMIWQRFVGRYVKFPFLFFTVAGLVLGTALCVAVIYLLSVVLRQIPNPIEMSTGIVALVSNTLFFRFLWKRRKKIRQWMKTFATEKSLHNHWNEILLCVASVGISTWLMTKTFSSAGGTLFIGSNEVFDFAHLLAIVRSFSLGNNLPFTSPFVAGQQEIYHFLFYFWAAIINGLGIPITWALNGVAIAGFSAMLVTIYYAPILLFGKKPIAGWILFALTLTHSTLTWLFYILKNGLSVTAIASLWRLPNYLFAGPFDGSAISIHMTLNVFLNQRHLAMGMALGMVLFLATVLLIRQKQWQTCHTVFFGLLFGLFSLWHMMISAAFVWCVCVYLFVSGKRKSAFGVMLFSAFGAIICFLPWAGSAWSFGTIITHQSKNIVGTAVPFTAQVSSFIVYWVQNLGISLVTAAVGFFLLSKKEKMIILPFLLLPAVSVVPIPFLNTQQKFLTPFLLSLNVLSTVTIIFLLTKRTVAGYLGVCVILFCLTASGVVDAMVIKNDFRFPVQDISSSGLMTFLSSGTGKHDVILGPSEMFDPITLSGRKNYWGFFRNPYQEDREATTKAVFESDHPLSSEILGKTGISFVLLPKKKKTDFPYIVNQDLWKASYTAAFEDDQYVLYMVQ